MAAVCSGATEPGESVGMSFSEDLYLFLNTDEMAVPVTAGSVSGNGILDMPSETIAGGMVVSTDYSLICRADLFGDLMHGAGINVDGYPYTLIGPPMLLLSLIHI